MEPEVSSSTPKVRPAWTASLYRQEGRGMSGVDGCLRLRRAKVLHLSSVSNRSPNHRASFTS